MDEPDSGNRRQARQRARHACPISEARLYCSFARNQRIRHELYIDAGDEEKTRAVYERLEAKRESLQAEYGRPLEFDPIEGKKACRIADYLDGHITDTQRHDEFIDWFVDTGQRWRRALAAVDADSAPDLSRVVGAG